MHRHQHTSDDSNGSTLDHITAQPCSVNRLPLFATCCCPCITTQHWQCHSAADMHMLLLLMCEVSMRPCCCRVHSMLLAAGCFCVDVVICRGRA